MMTETTKYLAVLSAEHVCLNKNSGDNNLPVTMLEVVCGKNNYKPGLGKTIE